MKNVEDVKLEMKIGKKKVFKKELSSREWKDLKNHGQIGYSYEYKNTGKLYDDFWYAFSCKEWIGIIDMRCHL